VISIHPQQAGAFGAGLSFARRAMVARRSAPGVDD
jgi:hypothetical protein